MYFNAHLTGFVNISIRSAPFAIEESSSWYFLYIQKGSVGIKRGEETAIYNEGDIFLIHPQEKCLLIRIDDNFIMSVEFSKDFFRDLQIPGAEIVCDSASDQKLHYSELIAIFQKIAAFAGSGEDSPNFLASLCNLKGWIKENCVLSPQETLKRESHAAVREKTERIKNLIEENYAEDCMLQMLSDSLFLSKSYLSKLIKANFKCTFSSYLLSVRLGHATEELTHSDHSITEVALNNGFPNVSAFSRAFNRIYHTSPVKYRKEDQLNSEKKHSAASASENADHGSADVPLPENETAINLASETPALFEMPFRDTINIGVLSAFLSSSCLEALEDVQKTVGFRYVRFQNVFSNKIIREIEGTDEFDFSTMDILFDKFKSLHLFPFIELSNKPEKSLIQGFLNEAGADSVISENKSLKEYCQYLKALLAHSLNRYGYSYVSKWRFEVWINYEASRSRALESTEEYLRRYESLRKIVKSAVPECEVGGPGFNVTRDPQSFRSILECARTENSGFDFLSLYIYGYSKTVLSTEIQYKKYPYSVLSSDRHHLRNTYKCYRSITDEAYSADTPLYVTEFNSSISGNHYILYSAFMSAFLCQNTADAITAGCPCLAYWSLSDVSQQFSRREHRFYSGTGLFDIYGIPKCSCQTLALMTLMDHKLVKIGSNYMVTTGHKGNYQILIWNYVHYNASYCINHLNGLPIDKTYTAFEEAPDRNVNLRLTGIPEGRYLIVRHTISRREGSLLDIFLKSLDEGNTSVPELLSLLRNLTKEEISYYKNISVPGRTTYLADCRDFILTASLAPHEIRLYELRHLI